MDSGHVTHIASGFELLGGREVIEGLLLVTLDFEIEAQVETRIKEPLV